MKSINKLFAMLFLTIIFFGMTSVAPDKIENFKLMDYNGTEYELNNFKNSKAIVIIFVATQCPVSNAYNERMEKLYEDYRGKDITFIGVNSNKQESVEEIKEHAESHSLKFAILKDVNNKIADKFQASFTPEVYVLNSKFEVLYHGRIDDSRREENVKTKDLRNALDEILNNKKVTTTETKAFGCSIKRVG